MRLLLMLCLLSGLWATPFLSVRADDPPAEAETDVSETIEQERSSEAEQEQKNLKKRKIEIGLILTGGIVVLGVFLVVLTLLYGRRTKRQLATGTGSSPPRDDLWYLKHSRKSSETADSESEREGESE